MRIVDIFEAGLPKDFQHSDWGYWIEPDGKLNPVSRHQHYAMYRIGWEAFASGRIRVTSISDTTKVKTDSGLRVFAANFFSNFVTKRALRSLMSLLNEYEFDIYTIAGMTFKDKTAFTDPDPDMTWEELDAIRTDSRSYIDGNAKNAAMRSARAFFATALDVAPMMLDATPDRPSWMPKQRTKKPNLPAKSAQAAS